MKVPDKNHLEIVFFKKQHFSKLLDLKQSSLKKEKEA